MENGYIVIPRNHPIWTMKPKAIKLFLWCLKEAQFQDYDYRYGSKVIHLKKGQLLTTLRALTQKTHLTYWETRRNLVCIKSAGLLQGFVQGSYQILTISNYESYTSEFFKTARVLARDIASPQSEKQQPISNNISINNILHKKIVDKPVDNLPSNCCGNCLNYQNRTCLISNIMIPPLTSSDRCRDFKAKESLESEVTNG